MRKHLYLITEHPNEDYVGLVRATEQTYVRVEKNKEGVVDKRDLDTGETWVEKLVGLGYHDFDGQDDYEKRFSEVAEQKLSEIDEEHLEKAGVELEAAA